MGIEIQQLTIDRIIEMMDEDDRDHFQMRREGGETERDLLWDLQSAVETGRYSPQERDTLLRQLRGI